MPWARRKNKITLKKQEQHFNHKTNTSRSHIPPPAIRQGFSVEELVGLKLSTRIPPPRIGIHSPLSFKLSAQHNTIHSDSHMKEPRATSTNGPTPVSKPRVKLFSTPESVPQALQNDVNQPFRARPKSRRAHIRVRIAVPKHFVVRLERVPLGSVEGRTGASRGRVDVFIKSAAINMNSATGSAGNAAVSKIYTGPQACRGTSCRFTERGIKP